MGVVASVPNAIPKLPAVLELACVYTNGPGDCCLAGTGSVVVQARLRGGGGWSGREGDSARAGCSLFAAGGSPGAGAQSRLVRFWTIFRDRCDSGDPRVDIGEGSIARGLRIGEGAAGDMARSPDTLPDDLSMPRRLLPTLPNESPGDS